MNLPFEEKYIIKLYSWNSYEDIPVEELIPFTDAKINTSEEIMLKQWERHFQGECFCKPKPYVITINPKNKKKTLWIIGVK